MAGSRRSLRGKLTGLLELHEAHPTAVEHELIRLGLRWRDVGSEAFTWRDLLVVVEEISTDSALMRAMHPDIYAMPRREMELLAYYLNVANVQRGNASGARRHDFPEPPAWARSGKESKVFGSDPLPFDEMAAFLDWDGFDGV